MKNLWNALEAEKLSSHLRSDFVHLKVLAGVAVRYHELGVNDKTLKLLDRIDLFANQIDDKNSIRFGMGNSYAIRGFVYRNQLSCDVAIDYFNRALHAYSIYDDQRSYTNQSVLTYNK